LIGAQCRLTDSAVAAPGVHPGVRLGVHPGATGWSNIMKAMAVRQLQSDIDHGFPRHWLGGDAFRTQFFNALSMTFPLGEQFFIDSVRAALPAVREPALQAVVQAFVGQEASHRQMHVRYNRQLEVQGLHFFIEPFLRWQLWLSRHLSVMSNLAMTMAYEHFTAIFADGILRRPHWLADASPSMQLLWTWHAVEEAEHKAVAFDVYRANGGGYVRRLAWFLYVSIVFALDIGMQTTNNLYRDGQLFKLRSWRCGIGYLLGSGGLLRHAWRPWLSYFHPRFTPRWRDNRELIAAWLSAHRADYRELRAALADYS